MTTDLSEKGLEAVDLESYRAERLASLKIALEDQGQRPSVRANFESVSPR
ncbi:MAG: hypothetical protein HY909_21210 [Deltaproteobacteria bacterium]|nr:hypothetical protein [Deltaproteobacteria bacterium]